jgi:ABC-type multidrug transport system ATPase subunit
MLLGLLNPDSGTVKVFCKPLSQNKDRLFAPLAGEPICPVISFEGAVPSLDDVFVTVLDGDLKRT